MVEHFDDQDQAEPSGEQWEPPQGIVFRAAVWVVLILIFLAIAGMIVAMFLP